MIDSAAHSAAFHQNCLTVLECYAVRDAAAKSAAQEYSGWLDRIVDVPGLEPAVLSAIHGYLIAQGLLRFEFTGRSVGLQYQISSLGRDSISRQSLSLADDSRGLDGAVESAADEKSQAA